MHPSIITPCLALAFLASAVSAKEVPSKPLPTAKPETLGMSSEQLAKIAPAVEKMIEKNLLAGGSVLVMRKGHIVYQNQFGFRNKATKAPVKADTIFRIFSMTKAVTSAAAMRLHEQGKIDLDAPIHKYIPELKTLTVWQQDGKPLPAKPAPTVRDLLRHTAGFSYGWSNHPVDRMYKKAKPLEKRKNLAEMVTAIKDIPLLYQPGTQWVYGINSDVLGRVVETASGEPLDVHLEKHFFKPLGMIDTGFYVPREKTRRFTVCYGGKGGVLVPIKRIIGSPYLQRNKHHSGGGGLVSTITDYARFLQMIANGGSFQGKRYLSKKSITLMTTNQLPKKIRAISFGKEIRHGVGFGLGFCVRTAKDKRWDPDAPVGEFGWGGAASTHYWVSPKHELVVVTMEQTMPYNWNLEKALKPIIYHAIKK
ncbi:MAG: serine hydrolase domain-containing protein [Akkermansiaceae bacterium]